MTDAYETGAIFTSAVPSWQRPWYEQKLLDTVRMKSILTPFAILKEDFSAVQTQQITYTEVYDMEPNWNSTSENTIWFKGGALDSRSQTIDLAVYHDILKFSDYHNLVDFINRGQIPQVVMDKIGQSLTDTLDILCRNAFLTHPTPTYAGTGNAARADLDADSYFDVNRAELARIHLEELEVPGVASNEDGGSQAIVCVTTPRVIHDIRTAVGSDWLDVQNYNQTGRKFTSEAGQWGGVRFIKTNRLRLWNAGAVLNQDTLNGATVPGQGAAATVDTVYTPGQSSSTRYITVTDETGFSVGDYVTIHSQPLGTTVLDSDGTQETRRIVSIDTGNNRISFDKPLLKDHANGDYITKARTVHASIFMGGPSIVYGVAERPNIITPPKIDDAMMVNRVGWRGMFKFQLFRPEWYEVHYSAGSTN